MRSRDSAIFLASIAISFGAAASGCGGAEGEGTNDTSDGGGGQSNAHGGSAGSFDGGGSSNSSNGGSGFGGGGGSFGGGSGGSNGGSSDGGSFNGGGGNFNGGGNGGAFNNGGGGGAFNGGGTGGSFNGGGGGAFNGGGTGGSLNTGGNGGSFNTGGNGGSVAESCVDQFTAPVMSFDDISVVTPIGLVGGGGTEIVGRSYVFPRSDIEGAIPVFAPTAMRLIGGVRYVPPNTPEDYHPDWALAFIPDCSSSVLIEIYHLKEVVPALSEAIGTEIAMSSAWQNIPPENQVHFNAGDHIGDHILDSTSVAWDFIVRDSEVTNEFANPVRYANSNTLHVLCPYTFYPPELRASFDALIGAPGVGPVEGATCGSVVVDVVGSIAGQWFFDPDPTTGRGELALINGYGNPHPIVKNPDSSITFGNAGASIQGFRVYPESPSWKDPAEVTDEHCYQLGLPGSPEGWLYYVVVSDSEMKLFYSSTGECPEMAPTTGGHTYYR